MPRKKSSGASAFANAETLGGLISLRCEFQRGSALEKALSRAFLWRREVGRAAPARVRLVERTGESLAAGLHLSLCDKSISRAAVLSSHPAAARGPAAPGARLASACEGVRARARV